MYTPEWYERNKTSIKAAKKRYYEKNKVLNPRPVLRNGVEYRMLRSAKHRAKKSGLAFDITIDDIIVPDLCPVLRIPLNRTGGLACVSSPSLDRRDSSKGYVKGNVFVISWRANKLKGDATVDEMSAILNYMQERD